MARPRLKKRIRFQPKVTFFKPAGIRLRDIKIVNLTKEEGEALRLRYEQGLNQVNSAKAMETSQSTFQRILSSAHTKLAEAIIGGYAVSIEE